MVDERSQKVVFLLYLPKIEPSRRIDWRILSEMFGQPIRDGPPVVLIVRDGGGGIAADVGRCSEPST
ncbi:MAG: hypothetical protein BRD24_11040 [Halobacteriales archaeon SW_9_67_24]|nr:MAG: hypothetical protein BRD24_11040 [Halobacteriales archaeon SW_9_67_24]